MWLIYNKISKIVQMFRLITRNTNNTIIKSLLPSFSFCQAKGPKEPKNDNQRLKNNIYKSYKAQLEHKIEATIKKIQ